MSASNKNRDLNILENSCQNKIDFSVSNYEGEKGFTTGSAAAGAAKAAALMLFTQKEVSTIEISTPAEIAIKLKITRSNFTEDRAKAVIIKKSGEDPDVTDGMEIAALVEIIPEVEGIKITAGDGVGTVTKPGLAVEEGEPAINPVPRRMIREEIKKIWQQTEQKQTKIMDSDENNNEISSYGLKVTISAPGGKKVAENTFNPRLGIKGGISILGTTGIVEPMSDKAYKDSLALKLSQARAQGWQKFVLVFGNYGKEMAREKGFPEEQIIRMSNYVGFMLEECCQENVNEILLMGQIGKLVKVAAGIFNTHSQIADARLETIAAYSAAMGAKALTVKKILNVNTSEEAVEIIVNNNLQEVFGMLAEKILERIEIYIDCDIKLGAVLFSLKSGILAVKGNTELLKGLGE